MKITFLFLISLVLSSAFILSSCAKDSEENRMENFRYCADSNVSFTNHILPLIQTECSACHSGASAEAGIELDDYAEIQSLAQSGDLSIVINHEAGLQPMPNGKPKWNDCKITTVEKWISEGMLNN